MTNLTLTSDLSGLLGRVEEATGADRELDDALWWALWCLPSGNYKNTDDGRRREDVMCGHGETRDWRPLGAYSYAPSYTASLDASLGLCERTAAEHGLRSHAVDLLNEAVEAMLARGWKPNQPTAPQIARYLIVVLLESLIARGEDDASDGKEIPGNDPNISLSKESIEMIKPQGKAMKRPLGTPLLAQISEPLPKVDDNSPGYGWRLSDQTRRQIEDAERQNAVNVARLLRDGFLVGGVDHSPASTNLECDGGSAATEGQSQAEGEDR